MMRVMSFFDVYTDEAVIHSMVFNIVARNQDDHVKNIAFLMDRKGNWSLSPAFDITYSYNPTGEWTSAHQMTLNGKRDDFRLTDFESCGEVALMKQGQAKSIIRDVQEVVSRWREFAEEAGVNSGQREAIQKTLRLEKLV